MEKKHKIILLGFCTVKCFSLIIMISNSTTFGKKTLSEVLVLREIGLFNAGEKDLIIELELAATIKLFHNCTVPAVIKPKYK